MKKKVISSEVFIDLPCRPHEGTIMLLSQGVLEKRTGKHGTVNRGFSCTLRMNKVSKFKELNFSELPAAFSKLFYFFAGSAAGNGAFRGSTGLLPTTWQ